MLRPEPWRSLRIARPLALAVAMTTIAITGTACSSTVSVRPGENANDPRCAELSTRLPHTLDGETRRWTDAQGSGAWGSPASIILRCGVAAPGPSALPCYQLGGVDWLAAEPEDDVQRAITYGREPAVEVVISRKSGRDFASVLESTGELVSRSLPAATSECTDRP